MALSLVSNIVLMTYSLPGLRWSFSFPRHCLSVACSLSDATLLSILEGIHPSATHVTWVVAVVPAS